MKTSIQGIVLGVVLSLLAPNPTVVQNPTASITVDAAASRHPINPQIYGVANANAATLADLNCPSTDTAATTRPGTTGS